ncbi:MAG TPA: NifB/NifX family molybdenum-iron cluster-binding protein [Desulfobacterales bacterium]
MKIAISSTGTDLDAQIDPRFGRCAHFVFLDTEDERVDAYENQSAALSVGAGIQAAEFVVCQGAEALITGHCGPNAVAVFAAAGIGVYSGQTGTVKDAVARLQAGELTAASQASAPENAGRPAAGEPGTAFGSGMGRYRGGAGRGMGRGMRRMAVGRGARVSADKPDGSGTGGGPAVEKETMADLRQQIVDLQRQIEVLQARIDALEK